MKRDNNDKIYLDGNVHTASYHLVGDFYTNAANREILTLKEPRQFHYQSGHLAHFNPNKTMQGECRSLERYVETLNRCLMLARIETGPSLRRIDFKVDCNSSEDQMKYWEKLGLYAVLCFMAYKHPLDKNANIRHSLFTGRMQSAEAFTDGYKVRCYDKAAQKEAEGVGRRFELSRIPRDAISEQEALRQLQAMLIKLPQYAKQAQDLCNSMILEVWEATMPDYGENRSINEFLRSRAEYIFTREQLKALYVLLGKTPQQAATATGNFKKRHKKLLHIFKQSDIEQFCNTAIDFIDNYINDTYESKII